jgi:hypothetical protein
VERVTAILIEHLARKWPFWLSPRQVRAEERAAPRTVYHGRGRVFELQPGFRFDLLGFRLALSSVP